MPEYELMASSQLPILDGLVADLTVWANESGTDEIVVVSHRRDGAQEAAPLVRIHSACLTGDVLSSLRCDCGAQLRQALTLISSADWGILIYPLKHEGRGIGLVRKVQSYAHQDRGLDTFEANEALGLDHDYRDYAGCAAILRILGTGAVRLLTRNPNKVSALERHGIPIAEVIPLDVPENPFNGRYLRRKREMFESIGSPVASR
jgi:GTP cyclohydrolase II